MKQEKNGLCLSDAVKKQLMHKRIRHILQKASPLQKQTGDRGERKREWNQS